MHKDKTRDMIRSILPSKAEKGSRKDRAQAHRQHRTQVRQAIHQFHPVEDWDDDDLVMEIHKSDFNRRRKIRYMVSERREADVDGISLDQLSSEQLRTLADLEDDRREGRITEAAYQRSKRQLLRER